MAQPNHLFTLFVQRDKMRNGSCDTGYHYDFQKLLHGGSPFRLRLFLGFFGFRLYDTSRGIVDVVRKITVIDALCDTLAGGSLIILVQSVRSTVEGILCILCAGLDRKSVV